MGACFIVSVLEIEKGGTPDWNAARKHIELLTDEQVEEAVMSAYQADSLKDIGCTDPRRMLFQAVKTIEGDWDEHFVPLKHNDAMIYAGSSWGESVDGIEEMAMLEFSGAAKAAGFL